MALRALVFFFWLLASGFWRFLRAVQRIASWLRAV